MAYVNITADNFEELVVNSGKTVLLDFWAPWCGPCRMVAPIVEAISEERQDLLLGKINVDEEMALAMRFGIVSIPTLIVMKGGIQTAKAVGYQSKPAIEQLLEA